MANLDATLSGTGSNSYVWGYEADAYFSTRYQQSASWSALSAADKTGSLLAATQALEGLHYLGSVTTATQLLAFPRNGVFKRNSYAFEPNGTIPDRVKTAQMEWASALFANTWQLNPVPEQPSPTKAGPVTIPQDKYGVFRRVPPQVAYLLDRLVDESISPFGVMMFR